MEKEKSEIENVLKLINGCFGNCDVYLTIQDGHFKINWAKSHDCPDINDYDDSTPTDQLPEKRLSMPERTSQKDLSYLG